MRLLDKYRAVRAETVALAEPLSVEDQMLQSMPDASPTKWHLAHTSWFFETFVLVPHARGYRAFDAAYAFLFNSYYEAVGPRVERARRGMLSRPSAEDVRRYRQHVDDAMVALLEEGWQGDERGQGGGEGGEGDWSSIVELGLHHEQQHQELLLTDIKHAFAGNPTRPVHARAHVAADPGAAVGPARFIPFAEGLVDIGHGGPGFAFDNEGPRHRHYLRAFALADRPVTCGEYLAFMRDGGYSRAELWLSEGWQRVEAEGWRAPLYWEHGGGHDAGWRLYTLAGMRPLAEHEAVAHVSYFEADAFARWAGARLPTEEEWERAAGATNTASNTVTGHFADSRRLHPGPARRGWFGDVWQWTRSPYVPYPGYQPPPGALGEYNGKFMSSQMVLRGGSCFTPAGHVRATYRNFFPPSARWQASGIRLARDV